MVAFLVAVIKTVTELVAMTVVSLSWSMSSRGRSKFSEGLVHLFFIFCFFDRPREAFLGNSFFNNGIPVALFNLSVSDDEGSRHFPLGYQKILGGCQYGYLDWWDVRAGRLADFRFPRSEQSCSSTKWQRHVKLWRVGTQATMPGIVGQCSWWRGQRSLSFLLGNWSAIT